MFQKQTWGGAIGIVEHISAIDHHCLTRITFGHRPAKGGEASADLVEHGFIEVKPASECSRRNLTSDVVFSWSQPTGRNNYLRTLSCVLDGFFQAQVVVTNNGFQFYFNADAVEFFGEPETIGVAAIRMQQLRTNGDNLRCEIGGDSKTGL